MQYDDEDDDNNNNNNRRASGVSNLFYIYISTYSITMYMHNNENCTRVCVSDRKWCGIVFGPLLNNSNERAFRFDSIRFEMTILWWKHIRHSFAICRAIPPPSSHFPTRPSSSSSKNNNNIKKMHIDLLKWLTHWPNDHWFLIFYLLSIPTLMPYTRNQAKHRFYFF